MKFRFCGDADCPDWILVEINSLSKLSSVKLKLLCQVVIQGILNPPINIHKAENIFSDSKLDPNIDLKACIVCISHIISSTIRFNCNSNALHSELQQLGLPREHSTLIKRVIDDQSNDLIKYFKNNTLKINPLTKASIDVDTDIKCVNLKLLINGSNEVVTMLPSTTKKLLADLKSMPKQMIQLNENSLGLSD